MSKVLVILEARAGQLIRTSLEAITAARQLGEPVVAVVVGAGLQTLAEQAARLGVDRCLHVEHALLQRYSADGWSLALEQLLQAEQPEYVLSGQSYLARDFLPALAVRFGRMVVASVVAIELGPVFVRPVYEGRLQAVCRATQAALNFISPNFISIEPSAFAAAEASGQGCGVELFTPHLEPEQLRSRFSEPYRECTSTANLAAAERIISVGRGLQAEENLPLVQALAEALGAELAGSRPVCDAGWLTADRQVGSSGQTVAPRLYLAVGISGATQHLQGMRGSGCIVAINKDPDAPLLEVADYALVGDLFELVPALTRALAAG